MAIIDPRLLSGVFTDGTSLLDLWLSSMLGGRRNQTLPGFVPDDVAATAQTGQMKKPKEHGPDPKDIRKSFEEEMKLRRKILEEREKRGVYNRTTSRPPQRFTGQDGRMYITNPADVSVNPEEDAIRRLLAGTRSSVYRRRLR